MKVNACEAYLPIIATIMFQTIDKQVELVLLHGKANMGNSGRILLSLCPSRLVRLKLAQ